MTKGELILIITTILGAFSAGLWSTIRLTRNVKTKGLKIALASLLVLGTLLITIALLPANLYLRDKFFYKSSSNFECSDQIKVYVGQYWKSGQSYSLDIENGDFKMAGNIIFDQEVSAEKEVGEYCCTMDSCQVRFTLDGKDSLFYIKPKETKRFFVGSSIDKEFVVLTNDNFGIRM